MAANSANNEPVNQDIQAHVRDYSGFTKLFGIGAVVCFIIGLLVLFIIS